MAECGWQPPNCSMPTKAAKQQDIGVTGGRKWEAMARKWSEKPKKKNQGNVLHTFITICT